MRQKDQVLQFNDREIELLQNTFGDDDEVLYILRKVMFQFELLPEEKGGLRTMTPELVAVLKKIFIREFEIDDAETPLGQTRDFLFELTEGGVFSRSIDEMDLIFKAKKLEMDYLRQQIEVLKNIDSAKEPIKFKDMVMTGDTKETYVNLIAKNHLTKHIDTGLVRILGMAANKKETLEYKAKKAAKANTK